MFVCIFMRMYGSCAMHVSGQQRIYGSHLTSAFNPQAISFAPSSGPFVFCASILTTEPSPQALFAFDILFPFPMSLGFKYSLRYHLPWKIAWLSTAPGLNSDQRVQATLDPFFHRISDTIL